jgi:hypothetical protein
MSAGDNYLAKSLELLGKAENENDPTLRAEFENWAAAFRRLAEQAVRNQNIRAFNRTGEGDPKRKP